ncbi:MAG: GGDEF domain-containing protein [Rhodobacter sp.]|uniref:GGDEF domain-containing protein n=1 Tax=Pararhodobacter sp. TaxID=2127056 RepID=UPI001D7A0C5F|nr:GGDEF domain-containing protein [Pararhodobacter sp.]MCB1346169.1 GGDEF domain-containing protein [Paracoccaceae bacterium]MCC0073623.1 GGDEF domain-containing protein [Rhodobacter sp.]HPD91734.1 GGDEF domain-containing protein [Pararhodobacter sp.]
MMDGDLRQKGVVLGVAALSGVMPLFLLVDAQCRIRDAGPTLRKLLGDDAVGQPLTAVFALTTPASVSCAGDLVRAKSLRLSMRAPPGTAFKGIAVPLAGGSEVLVNLSFGYALRDAVRDHALLATDFAPTDLAIELLYLVEANLAVTGEVKRMASRFEGAKARAEEQAVTDALTGLGNRRAMELALERFLHAGNGFGVLHLDLDYFKQVNDSLGHAAGDHVLIEVAQRLRGSVRGGDLVARVGGDEFVILLGGVRDLDPLRRIGALILNRMQAPISYGGAPCRVAISIGAVLVPPEAPATAEGLLEQADVALYTSKRAGRSRMSIWCDAGPPQEVAVSARSDADEPMPAANGGPDTPL